MTCVLLAILTLWASCVGIILAMALITWVRASRRPSTRLNRPETPLTWRRK